MKRFKNILVVINTGAPENDPALARGVALAKQNQASLTLMDVVNPPQDALSKLKGMIQSEDFTAMLVREKEQALSKIAQNFTPELQVQTKIAVGRDFIEIIRQVMLGKHDILMKVANNHPKSFDSSDFHLMRKCPKPVWLFKAEDLQKPKKILATIDLSLESYDEGKALNAFIMDLATSFAQWENSEVHLLSCWYLYGEDSLRHSGFLKVTEEKLADMLAEEEKSYQNLLDSLLARYSGIPIQAHLLKGDPVELIPSFVCEHQIETVVMGTVARTGIPGLLIGNTAETILHKIKASVITLKPSGFESPIKKSEN